MSELRFSDAPTRANRDRIVQICWTAGGQRSRGFALMEAKQLIKRLIIAVCGRRLAQSLRHRYLVRQVVKRRGSREPEMLALKTIVSAGDSVADIGANVGVYTEEFSSLVGVAGRVYSFEPIVDTYEILKTVIDRGKLSNVECFRAALGSHLGEHEMIVPDLGAFVGYYWAHRANPGDAGRREIVPVWTLDQLYKKNTIRRLDFIKCDVEGGELDVIEGARSVIHDHTPGWLVEVSKASSVSVFGLFKDFGYRSFVYDGGLIQTETYQDQRFSNYFFFHPMSTIWNRALKLTRQA